MAEGFRRCFRMSDLRFQSELTARPAVREYKDTPDDFPMKMSKQYVCVVMEFGASTDSPSTWARPDP